MKVYEIEVVEVQHVICRYFVKASSEVEAKAKAMDGCTFDDNELGVEQISQRIVGDIIDIQDIDEAKHTIQNNKHLGWLA